MTDRQAATAGGAPFNWTAPESLATDTVTAAPGASSSVKVCHWPEVSQLADSGWETRRSSRCRNSPDWR